MHIITRKRLNDFATKYPDAHTSLEHWYRIMKGRQIDNFAELRELFPSADQVPTKLFLISAATISAHCCASL
jgi:mRNA interferase HigB